MKGSVWDRPSTQERGRCEIIVVRQPYPITWSNHVFGDLFAEQELTCGLSFNLNSRVCQCLRQPLHLGSGSTQTLQTNHRFETRTPAWRFSPSGTAEARALGDGDGGRGYLTM